MRLGETVCLALLALTASAAPWASAGPSRNHADRLREEQRRQLDELMRGRTVAPCVKPTPSCTPEPTCTPRCTPRPTSTPQSTPEPKPTATATAWPTPAPTARPTPTPTPTPTASATPRSVGYGTGRTTKWRQPRVNTTRPRPRITSRYVAPSDSSDRAAATPEPPSDHPYGTILGRPMTASEYQYYGRPGPDG